jgi:hypothetical protein
MYESSGARVLGALGRVKTQNELVAGKRRLADDCRILQEYACAVFLAHGNSHDALTMPMAATPSRVNKY